MTQFTITQVDAGQLERELDAFAALLHACVHGGASIGFILPHTPDDARHYWLSKVLPALQAGGVRLLTARRAGQLVGTVQLDHDTPGNGRHRAEVRKLLVPPSERRQGIGRALMQAAQEEARALGRSLLTLDTRTGSEAEPLYLGLGFVQAGIIPFYCRDALEDRLDSTTLMYKTL